MNVKNIPLGLHVSRCHFMNCVFPWSITYMLSIFPLPVLKQEAPHMDQSM